MGRRVAPSVVHNVPQSSAQELVDKMNSLLAVLSDLAGERYQRDATTNVVCIMTVREQDRFAAYRNGNYAVMFIPVIHPPHRYALEVYAHGYNCGNEQAADTKAKTGDYTTAREIYQLLKRFGREGEWERVEQKLALLDELEKVGRSETTVAKFVALCNDYANVTDFAQIDQITPVAVTNLFELP